MSNRNNFKKTTTGYTERSEEKRASFDEALNELPEKTSLVYIDECGVDAFMQRNVGWAKKGDRVEILQPGRRFKRINVISALCDGKMIGTNFYEQNTTADLFNDWFEKSCPLFPAHSVIIMDNARFHRKSDCEEIVTAHGHSILWLPPYSPDKNLIERAWANMKNWLRIHAQLFLSIQDALHRFFISD